MSRCPVGTKVKVFGFVRDARFNGIVATVTGYRIIDGDEFHATDFRDPEDGLLCGFEYKNLRPIRDDDANTVTSWADCIWKPEGVAA